jgi:hypothetical protein
MSRAIDHRPGLLMSIDTDLTDYEISENPEFVSFAHEALARGACEIGMHLHLQVTPPLDPLTDDDMRHQPYVMKYPDDVGGARFFVLDLGWLG